MIASLAALSALGGWVALPQRAAAVEPYFCIELVLSRNWPAARFYCDAASTPDNVGIKLAEGIAFFFGAQNTADVSHAARLWREVPPIADQSEWRNISGVFEPEIKSVERDAANLDRVAQFKLGVLLETGHFETPDPAAALFRYEQAARANLPEAHLALARIYQEGVESIGVEADPVLAEQHLMKAIELRTPAQRQVPAEPTMEIDVGAVAEAEVTVEPTQVNDDAVSGTYRPESSETADQPVETAALTQVNGDTVSESLPSATAEVSSMPEVAGAAEAESAPVESALPASAGLVQSTQPATLGASAQANVAAGATAVPQSSAPATTPTGSLPTDRRSASDVDLAPEVLAALLAAAEGVDSSSESGRVSATAQSATSASVNSTSANGSDTAAVVETAEPLQPESSGGGATNAGSTGAGNQEDGGNWSPPAEVAALYYPTESLEGGSSSGNESGAQSTTRASSTAAAGDDATSEEMERLAQSCAASSSGATLAMPVVPEEDDIGGDDSEERASHVADPAALAAIEQGIRAKTAGDFDGALSAWEPYGRQGNAMAQYLVGLLYLTGEATPDNLRSAYAWLSLATAQGHQLAGCELYRLYQRMSAQDVAMAKQQAEGLVRTP